MNHVNLKKPSLYIIINSRNNSRQLFLLRKISENFESVLRVLSSGDFNLPSNNRLGQGSLQ